MSCIFTSGDQRTGASAVASVLPMNIQVSYCMYCIMGFPGGSDGKESACNAGDVGLIPESGSSPLEKGMATHSSILAWSIPWTEEPDGL